MKFLKKSYVLRRYSEPTIIKGYAYTPYKDYSLLMDVQTLSDQVITTPDGSKSIRRLKVFCDKAILVEDESAKQKADRIWFRDAWFECQSSRLSENTPLRHWTATFVECLYSDPSPFGDNQEYGTLTDDEAHKTLVDAEKTETFESIFVNSENRVKQISKEKAALVLLEALPVWEGDYSVTPKAFQEVVLETAQKKMDSDVVVEKIPYSEVTNTANGKTVTIG